MLPNNQVAEVLGNEVTMSEEPPNLDFGIASKITGQEPWYPRILVDT